MGNSRRGLAALVLALGSVGAAQSQGLECLPCAAVQTSDPEGLARVLANTSAPTEEVEARLLVKWEVTGGATSRHADALRQAGATPVPAFTLTAPSPLTDNLAALESELEAVAQLAREVGKDAYLQVVWTPSTGAWNSTDYAFALKRAAVTITGAAPGARVMTSALEADPEVLRALYDEEISAYIDVVALAPASEERIGAAIDILAEIDPGRPILIDSVALEGDPSRALGEAAAAVAAGAHGAFVELLDATSESVAPLVLLAQEFSGDLSFDPATAPSGAAASWSFVRGEDLTLRVIVDAGTEEELTLLFPDPHLKRAERIDIASGEIRSLPWERRGQQSLVVTVTNPEGGVLLRLERLTADEIEGLAGLTEQVTVASERQIPVEEILSRLQAFEDDQARRLDHYQAINTTHMRFQLTGLQAIEVTFRGAFFFRRDEGFDWAWQNFYVNGVRWRSKRIPRIPLVQPEKAAALPLEILFTPEYRYRLKGTASVRGRDCWVIEFKPTASVEGRSLFQGTVWIDRELFTRVRTRAVQLGLEGDVISNENTLDYTPVGSDGQAAAWSRDALYLPTHTIGQQIWSVLNTSTVVESETELTNLILNGADFEERREVVLSSEATMVRDTTEGLRYLITDKETGERVVQEKLKPSRIFLGGGVFFDESLDYPVPLAGIDYFSLNFKDTGAQVNVFFAGALLNANIADPSLFGSRWDIGVDLFGIAVEGDNEVFENGRELIGEEVEVLPARFALDLGHTIGNFGKIDFSYGLAYQDFSRSENTSEDFTLPSDHFTHSFSLTGRYNRAGYRLRLGGTHSSRSEWEPWGLPGSPDFSPDNESFNQWAAGFAKNWHLPRFQRIGLEIEYVDGNDLDRFSKYEFGFFSDIRVHGYQSDKVRAERAWATHMSYGFEMGEIFRLSLIGDAAFATDEAAGLSDELLAGVGIEGNFVGPWRTIVSLDLGLAVAGPDDGTSVFLTFLKLFN